MEPGRCRSSRLPIPDAGQRHVSAPTGRPTSVLIDEACGIAGNALLVCEGPQDDLRVLFVGLYYRWQRHTCGECRRAQAAALTPARSSVTFWRHETKSRIVCFSLGTDTDASTAREHALLGTIRALLLALLFVGMVGMGSELVLLGHYEDTVQLLPLLLLVAGLVVVLWQAVRSGAASVRVLRFVMGLFVASGLIGVGYHYTGNAEFARELYPSMETITLFREALSGATPTLAPGSMMLLGFMGLIYAHRHPRLSRHGIGVERPIHQEVRS